MKNRFGRKSVLIIILLVLASVALMLSIGRDQTPVSQYFTSPVTRGQLRNVVNATGVIQTVVTVQVGSQVSGQVQALYADFNSVVKRGQLLAKLDPRNVEAQLENSRATVSASQARVRSSEADLKTQAANLLSAKANLEAARVTRDNTATMFQRASDLSKSGVASRNEFDTAKANADSSQAKYEQAQAAVQQVEAQGAASQAQLEQVKAQLEQSMADLHRAEINLEYTNIYSPVDGVVISRSIDVGQTIAATMQSPTLFSIANDLKRMQVNANVDEADIGNITDAADVKFTVDAYPNETFAGRIAEIRLSPQTVQNVVTYSVILSIDNPEMKLKPGMTANITITVDQRADVLKVPNAALRYTPTGMEGGNPESPSDESTTSPDQSEELAAPELEEQVHVPQAPGQNWDTAGKLRFSRPQKTVHRQAVAWIQNVQGKLEPRHIVLGITDGSSSEIIAGELKEGDPVIIGDSAQGASGPTPQQGQGGFGPFGR